MKEALATTNQERHMDEAERRISILEDTSKATQRDLRRAEKLIKTLED